MDAVSQIRQIDRNINGVCSEVYRRVGRFNALSADHWQLAWDRFPDLHAHHTALYRQRGQLQLVRDAELEREFKAEQRAEQRRQRTAIRKTVLKRCDACGEFSRVAA